MMRVRGEKRGSRPSSIGAAPLSDMPRTPIGQIPSRLIGSCRAPVQTAHHAVLERGRPLIRNRLDNADFTFRLKRQSCSCACSTDEEVRRVHAELTVKVKHAASGY